MADEASNAPDTGALSVEQAVEALQAPMDKSEAARVLNAAKQAKKAAAAEAAPVEAAAEEDEQPEAEALDEATGDDTESEAETTAEEDLDPEEAIEGEQDEEPESDPDEPVIAAPKSWSAEERAAFAKLPRDLQQVVAGREEERDRATSKALQEAATARQAAEREAQEITTRKGGLTALIERAEATFKAPSVKDQWASVDWRTWYAESPAEAAVARIEYEEALQAEADAKTEYERLKAAKAEADELEFQSFKRAEAAKLAEVAPDLVDPEHGNARLEATSKFLLELGFEPEALRGISAIEAAVAYDAYRWRQAQAKARATATTPPRKPNAPAQPKPTPPAAAERRPAAIRPSAPSNAPPPRQRQATAALERLKQSGSIDDAVAYLKSKG